MVDFHKDWYENLVAHSNEKSLLVDALSDALRGQTHNSCLEIGVGTSAYFSERLGEFFEEYWIIEKNEFQASLQPNVKLLHGDFEEYHFDKKFDVIIASHIVYYFKNLSEAVRKILFLLKDGGCVFFVVNGKESDYGRIKNAFAEFIHVPYTFTYDLLITELKGMTTQEHTAKASLSFTSHRDLYEALRLSFDLYPKEYEAHKEKMITWLKTNIHGNQFFIDQKIVQVEK